MPQLFEVTEVAKLLKCNKNKVYELIKSGQLQGLKLGRMKVSTIELENFMTRNVGRDLTDPFNVKQLEGGDTNENQHSRMETANR